MGDEKMVSSASLSPSSREQHDGRTVPPKHPSGRTKFRETRHQVYCGVGRRGNAERCVCELRGARVMEARRAALARHARHRRVRRARMMPPC